MAKQLDDLGLFWRMVWQQEVEKIVMLTNLVEGKNSEERSLHHLQFTSWPTKDVPDNVTSLIELRQRVNTLPRTFGGPVIVHCSAGVGRTGTYIALDILTNQGETEGAINIPGCVLNMRQNRPSMIQTLSQYKFLHEALVHSLTLDCSLISREHFHKYMSSKQKVHQQYESFKTKNRFLVAQTPLPDTVSDFLTLAVQENCSCIVNMEANLEKHEM
ncbi:tyrosine-protein phosphatase non-receptor type 7-like [Mya arenaria]|uniref:tyrosine-protein phosphatase non-receptor type 7-like n=1 Tax=Mya arenaria TaxID=6604 RepID=UPI0022E75D58|nr:tyrosine-protein phosphatase non-receptor type 7-like [Mya arenaria]